MARPVIKLTDLVDNAEVAFWEEVCRKFPDVTTGDSDPHMSTKWTIRNEEMVKNWWWWNASDQYDLELPDGTIMKGE